MQKNYHEYEEFITIMGEGFVNYIKKASENKALLSSRGFDSLYRLSHRTVTAIKYQGSDNLSDWMLALSALFEIPQG